MRLGRWEGTSTPPRAFETSCTASAARAGAESADLPYQSEVDAIFKDACAGTPRAGEDADCRPCDEPPPCKEKPCGCGCDGGDGCQECGCGCHASLVSDDKALVLLMAALHVACGNTVMAQRFVRIVLDQLCRFEMLGALHRASVKAVLGDEASRAHVRDLYEFLCGACDHDGRRDACAVRRAPACCDTCLDERLMRCLRQAVEAWCCIECYCITEVRPPRACPGDEVVEVCNRFLEHRCIGCVENGFAGTSPRLCALASRPAPRGSAFSPASPCRSDG